jgi:sugar lactone lactonase YvrE
MSRHSYTRTLLVALVSASALSCQIVEGGDASTSASGSAPYTGFVAPGYVVDAGVVQPVNNLPNPYETQRDWGRLPNGRTWGSVSALEVDPDGRHLWVAERCGTNRCTGFTEDVIVKLDPEGNVVTSFGAGVFIWPHGMHIDRDGNIWVTDASSPSETELQEFPGEANKGHVVHKFSPTGQLLLTLGTPGVRGDGTGPELAEPNDVIVAPNGDILVAEAHSGQNLAEPTPTTVARISRFSSDGRYLGSFGSFGAGPGQLKTPHALAFDSQGRLFIADRGNNRLSIFDQNGNFIEEWKQFSRISGLVITADDVLYAIDSESGPRNPGWRKGLRVGSARTGEVWYYVPQHDSEQSSGGGGFGAMGEGVAVDAAGNVFGGEVGPVQGLTRFVPRLGMARR